MMRSFCDSETSLHNYVTIIEKNLSEHKLLTNYILELSDYILKHIYARFQLILHFACHEYPYYIRQSSIKHYEYASENMNLNAAERESITKRSQ